MDAINQEQAEKRNDHMLDKIKGVWGRLADDEVALYSDHRDQFFAVLEKKYGLLREEAEDRLQEIRENSDFGSQDRAA